MSGLVFDTPSRSIRPILGVAGAGYLGKPLISPIEFASVAPDGDTVLVISEGQSKLARGLNTGSPTSTLIEELSGIPDEIVWAPDVSSLVAYYASTRQLFLVAISSDKLLGASLLDASSLPGEVRSVTVSEGGATVLVGMRDAEAGGVYRVSADAPPSLVASVADPAAMVTVKGGRAVYAVDAGARLIIEIQDAGHLPQVVPLIEEPDDRFDPVGLAVDRGGLSLYVANARSRTIFVYDLASRTRIGELATEAAPELLKPLPGSASFLLAKHREAGEPIWILDTADTGSTYFIPDGGQE
ncbi:MAG: lactonase family protein [Acidobacteriales bacterium]|nr:lactonase family protein [Terriglobales bacterium]